MRRCGSQLIHLNAKDEQLGVTWLHGIHFEDLTTTHLFLHDYFKWGPLQDELDEWCVDNNCERRGTIITFHSVDAEVMFKLRWG